MSVCCEIGTEFFNLIFYGLQVSKTELWLRRFVPGLIATAGVRVLSTLLESVMDKMPMGQSFLLRGNSISLSLYISKKCPILIFILEVSLKKWVNVKHGGKGGAASEIGECCFA